MEIRGVKNGYMTKPTMIGISYVDVLWDLSDNIYTVLYK